MIKYLFLALCIIAWPGGALAQFDAQQTFCSGSCVGGTGNAIILHVPNVVTLADLVGVPTRFTVATANTGPTTLTVGSAATAPLMKISPTGLAPLIGGELQIGPPAPTMTALFDGTEFVLMTSPAPPVALTAPLNYYVNSSTGSDANNCLTALLACATIQHALVLTENVNTTGYFITINVACGSYAQIQLVPINGSGSINITGNPSNPSCATISAPSGASIIASTNGYNISGFQLSAAANSASISGACIYASGSIVVGISNINFGACVFADILAQFGATVVLTGADEGFPSDFITVLGPTPAFIYALASSTVGLSNTILNINGPINFSLAFAVAISGASVQGKFSSINITGGASGARFIGELNATFNTGTGVGYFPGNSPGALSTGAQYQ